MCFICLDPGHFKVRCTSEIRCHRCWFTGHLARDCSSTCSPPPSLPRASHICRAFLLQPDLRRPSRRIALLLLVPRWLPPPRCSMVHYPPLARIRFQGETWAHGNPNLRSERGGDIISCTRGIDALEVDFHGRALLTTLQGRRSVVSP
ncbi:hypothetical protein ZWY2020_048319 [Hordeum vulgare]|nr:hypothetical protein ZWY2020_048319 [Hordeum vulgare]